MAASPYSAIRTRVVTEAVASRPPPTSTRARPVITSCTRPRSARSMRPAVAASAGLPSARPSRKTSVSAPRTRVGPAIPAGASSDTRWATARAFARATAPPAPAGGAGCNGSGIPLGRTGNGMPRRASSSCRRGEAEARISEGRRPRRSRRLGDDQRVGVGDDAIVPLDRLAEELGEIERVQMGRPAPVAELVRVQRGAEEPVDLLGALPAGIRVLAGEGEAPWRSEAGDEPLVGAHPWDTFPERPFPPPV